MEASETVGEDSRGYDGGTSRDGRKRHILTDMEGLLLEVTVTTADVHDSKAAPALLETFMEQSGRLLKLVWVDSDYQGPAPTRAFARHGVRVEVVRRSDGQRGFVVLARRWVVERTLSWLSRSRRLNRDHERRPDHHQQIVWVGSHDQAVPAPGPRRSALAGEASRPTAPGAGMNRPSFARSSQPRFSST
ncbi:transposase [Streptomyces sp. NPDC002519]